MMHYLHPSTAPWPIAVIVAILALWLIVRLIRFLRRAWSNLIASWKVEDEKHFRAVFREHQKSHEGDRRSY